MQNLFLLPTEKPSRLFKFANQLHLDTIPKDYYKKYNIYITSDEEIKEDDWGLSKLNEVILFGRSYNEKFYKKIILTTDQDLIAHGIQAIDDEFLEWFVKNPICEFVETKVVEFEVDMGLGDECIERGNYYKIIIPQQQTNPSPTENPPIKNGDVYDMGQTVNGLSRFLFFNEKWYYFEERLSREYEYDQSELTKLVNDTENDFNEVKYIGNIFTLNLSKNK
jgi:hypothetical protein